MEWKHWGPRLFYLRLHEVSIALAIIYAYARTEDSSDSDKDNFFSALQKCQQTVLRKVMLVIGGDFNAKVYSPLDREKSIRHFTLETRNAHGDRLTSFAVLNDLVISTQPNIQEKETLRLPGAQMMKGPRTRSPR